MISPLIQKLGPYPSGMLLGHNTQFSEVHTFLGGSCIQDFHCPSFSQNTFSKHWCFEGKFPGKGKKTQNEQWLILLLFCFFSLKVFRKKTNFKTQGHARDVDTRWNMSQWTIKRSSEKQVCQHLPKGSQRIREAFRTCFQVFLTHYSSHEAGTNLLCGWRVLVIKGTKFTGSLILQRKVGGFLPQF